MVKYQPLVLLSFPGHILNRTLLLVIHLTLMNSAKTLKTP